jgi:hypothetical protein
MSNTNCSGTAALAIHFGSDAAALQRISQREVAAVELQK